MAENKLHPSVSRFKEFVTSHPHIIQDVRDGRATWQELYEDWYLLGEEDPRWIAKTGTETVNEPAAASDGQGAGVWMEKLMNYAQKMDPAQFQSHLYNLSQTLGAVQGLLNQFRSSPPPQQAPAEIAPPPQLFPFRKD
ncbi:YlbD family protein [Bacillus sp. B-jedd]|uniref:YlbD family protein n=1 Tax=Bacillus sp. B-jedd TaxID=1476857 RepID=UPI0005156116|nr:YlbD family protein [Bacillus sp. B-jedd]CEG26701.1 cytoplasmic protein [Bacillus sp. B-jedd]